MIFLENCIKWMTSEWAGEGASSPLMAYPSLSAYHVNSIEQVMLRLHLQWFQEILPPNEYSHLCQWSLGNLCIWSHEDSIAQKHLWKFFFGPDFRVFENHIHVWGPQTDFWWAHVDGSLLTFYPLSSAYSNLLFIWESTPSPFHVVPQKTPPSRLAGQRIPFPWPQWFSDGKGCINN